MVCVSHVVQVVLTRRPNFARKKGNASSSAGRMVAALTPFVLFEVLTLEFSNMGDARLFFITIPSRFHSLRIPPTTVCQVSARKHSLTTLPSGSGMRCESDEFERNLHIW